jgi:hypothetical protein
MRRPRFLYFSKHAIDSLRLNWLKLFAAPNRSMGTALSLFKEPLELVAWPLHCCCFPFLEPCLVPDLPSVVWSLVLLSTIGSSNNYKLMKKIITSKSESCHNQLVSSYSKHDYLTQLLIYNYELSKLTLDYFTDSKLYIILVSLTILITKILL